MERASRLSAAKGRFAESFRGLVDDFEAGNYVRAIRDFNRMVLDFGLDAEEVFGILMGLREQVANAIKACRNSEDELTASQLNDVFVRRFRGSRESFLLGASSPLKRPGQEGR